MRARFGMHVDIKRIAARHACGRMQDDGVADGGTFRIERLLHHQRAAMLPFGQRGAPAARGKRRRRLACHAGGMATVEGKSG